MSPLLRRAWQAVRSARPTIYALLMFTPMIVKPSDFVKTPRQPQPIYTRLPGLWGTPLIVGGIFATIASSVIEWAFVKSADPTIPLSKFVQHLTHTQDLSQVIILSGVAALLYGISILRWGYHCAAIHVLSRWWPMLTKPRPIFFLVNTTAWGFWASLYTAGLFQTIKWWDESGQPSFVLDEQHQMQSVGLILALVAFGGFMHFASSNSISGMKALYGGSRTLSLLVELIGVAMLMLFTYTITAIA